MLLTVRKPMTETTTPRSTMVATPKRWLPARSTSAALSKRSTTAGTRTTFNATERPASTYSSRRAAGPQDPARAATASDWKA